jgi:hypothetical protein
MPTLQVSATLGAALGASLATLGAALGAAVGAVLLPPPLQAADAMAAIDRIAAVLRIDIVALLLVVLSDGRWDRSCAPAGAPAPRRSSSAGRRTG